MPATETPTSADPTATTNEEGSVGVPWRSPTLIAILAATVITPMDVPLISPTLTEVQAVFGVSESRAGLLVTIYALPGILLAPVIGAVADRVGRRYVLSGCLAVFGASGTAIAFTTEFTVALGLRVVQGTAAGSLLSAVAMTIVGDRYRGQQHDAVMGVTSAVLAIGTAAYPAIGGILAGRAWNRPFLVYALALPVAGLVFVCLDDRRGEVGAGRNGYLREALRALPIRRTLTLYGIMFVAFSFLFGGIYTVLPFYLASRFDAGPETVGLATSAMLVVTAFVSIQNGRLSARTARNELLVFGFGLYAVGFLGAALAGGFPQLLGALLLFGAGSGLVTPTLFSGISALAPDHVRGGVMSLQTTVIGASQAVAPIVFTFLGGALGYRPTILAMSGAGAVGMILISLLPGE